MRQARNCWPVLVRKAQDKVNDAQTAIAQALAKVEQLQASHERLCTLYDEYRLQENQSTAPIMGMQSRMNHRQFMAQLLTLQQRVVTDLGKAKAHLVQMRIHATATGCDRSGQSEGPFGPNAHSRYSNGL